MGPDYGFILLVIVASSQIFFVYGIGMKRGTFFNLHRHSELKSCADEVLKENLCVGGRVQKLTGGCECLNHSWGINQTMQAGYAYTKKISVEELFRPPVNFTERKAFGWVLPGVVREGAKVEITVSAGTTLSSISLTDTLDEIVEYFKHHDSFVKIGLGYTPINNSASVGNFAETDGNLWVQGDDKFVQLKPTNAPKTKISFLALSDSLWVLVDDQTIFGKNVTLDLTTVRQIVARPLGDGALIHSFKFIDA